MTEHPDDDVVYEDEIDDAQTTAGRRQTSRERVESLDRFMDRQNRRDG